nr:uncharacterized protein LOC123766485 isoform X1 [Procambarus clarkii]
MVVLACQRLRMACSKDLLTEVLPRQQEVLLEQQNVPPGNKNVFSGNKALLSGKVGVLGPQRPHVSEAGLREALMLDQGQDARLLSWTRHDFTNKGDNYVADITSVNVKFCQNGRERQVSYVVKMKHNKRKGCTNDFDDMVFYKEGKFYTELLPLINHELKSAGMTPLRVPRCLHAGWNESQNQLFLEDLRPLGFKLHDRKKHLSVSHAALVLRELARLHAASVLFLSKIPKEDLKSKFKFLKWEMFNYSEQTKNAYDVLIRGSLQTASELARAAGSYDMQQWFGTLSVQGTEVLMRQIRESSAFDVIGHGDCWVNNFLFRYDAAGQPVEVMLLDFQLCRKTSLAYDLNYFLFSSLAPAEKNARLEELIVTYYTTFREVTRAAGVVMPYTVDDITNEFYNRNMVGLIFGALAIPALVCDAQDAQEFDVASGEHTHNYVINKRQNALMMLKKNPLMSSRLASLYEDIRIYAGIA